MDSVNYLRGLMRSWWLIVLVVIAGGAGGYVVYHRQIPLYQSSIRLVVATSTRSLDPTSAQALAGSEAQALAQFVTTTPGIADATAKAGYPGATPAVTANSNVAQPFVDISVTSPDPVLARKVAQAYASTAEATKTRLSHTRTNYTATALARASAPGAPISPDPKQDIGLGIAAGLVLGLALALLRESLNRTLRTSDELQELTGLKILGTVPRDMPKTLLPARSHPRSARAEAYRQVRTSVQSASDVRPLTVAVTSATLGEGKTSVATNLAAVFSRAGHRVVLIDADLRRPRVAAFFDLDGDVGLTEVLSGEVSLDDALQRFDDGRFAVLTSGHIPANPSEALGSPTMVALLEQLARDFEYIVVDTPPVLPVTDALVLAPHMDGVVFVARLGHTTRERVTRAKAIIDRVEANVLGVVPNQAGKGSDSDYRYPYRYSTKRGRGAEAPPTIPTDAHIDLGGAGTSREPAVGTGTDRAAETEPAAGAAAVAATRDSAEPAEVAVEAAHVAPAEVVADDAETSDAETSDAELDAELELADAELDAIQADPVTAEADPEPDADAESPGEPAAEVQTLHEARVPASAGRPTGASARSRSRAARRQQRARSHAPARSDGGALVATAERPADLADEPVADTAADVLDASANDTSVDNTTTGDATTSGEPTPDDRARRRTGIDHQNPDLLFPDASGWPRGNPWATSNGR